jgi:C_GCAxxG_C_C family probable redox protein
MCEMCGALTGAYMVIGLKHGKLHSDGTKYGVNTETTYRLVAEIAARFTERNGSTHCRDLIEHDLSDLDQRAEVVRLGYFKTRCGKYISDSVDLLEEILNENDMETWKNSTP